MMESSLTNVLKPVRRKSIEDDAFLSELHNSLSSTSTDSDFDSKLSTGDMIALALEDIDLSLEYVEDHYNEMMNTE